MVTTFVSSFKILNSSAFHKDLHAAFGENCASHCRGEAVPEYPESTWPSDFFSIGNPNGTTSEIQPHIEWLKSIYATHQTLLREIKLNGGSMEFTVIHGFDSPRGSRIALSESELKAISNCNVGFEILACSLDKLRRTEASSHEEN